MHHWRQGAHSRFIKLNAPKANTNKSVLIQSPFRELEILPLPAYGFIIKHKDVKKVEEGGFYSVSSTTETFSF